MPVSLHLSTLCLLSAVTQLHIFVRVFFFFEVGKLTSRLYCGSYREMLNKANLLYSESREFQVSDKHVISALINVV